ncbi:Cof-type HAD-IIB family hydrolase [Lentibacillus salicampi]|uniref:Cof-type HAD-IIB family hydrolase n=1 Tax=Lentibacillus salicampi TaxID=175306 RepID=A0A4Y9A8U5_9BACI|nr:Cof-type HAD-IIB family hydrolase [Lentibacillus salicampi]TFJ91672.1 Cof-type HAD-IIB family hydrolase [Lentibacillus salicampi]
MVQKLIFFDIDGTLLNDEKQLPGSTRQAINELQTAGHLVAIATGRAPFAFKSIQKELNINSYVSTNGQYVVHDNEVIYKNPITPTILEGLEKYSAERNHPLVHLNNNDWYSNTKHHPFIKEAIDSLKIGRDVTYDPEFYRDGEVYQTLLFCADGEAEYNRTFDQLNFVRWHNYSVDVTPSGGSKAEGISRLIRQLQIPANDIYAFGDGLNDIEMLRSIQNSFAMGNASDVVKKAASSVTKDVNDDGIWHGLKMAGLLGKGHSTAAE